MEGNSFSAANRCLNNSHADLRIIASILNDFPVLIGDDFITLSIEEHNRLQSVCYLAPKKLNEAKMLLHELRCILGLRESEIK